jgi:hypothetical protein
VTAKAALARVVAGIGLILMVPLAVQLVQGTLTSTDAAVRAVALLVGAAVARALLTSIPGRTEVVAPGGSGDDTGPLAVDATVTTGRRRTDADGAEGRAA